MIIVDVFFDDESKVWTVKIYPKLKRGLGDPYHNSCVVYDEWPWMILKVKEGRIIQAEYLICMDPYGIGVEKWYESIRENEYDWLLLAIADVCSAGDKLLRGDLSG